MLPTEAMGLGGYPSDQHGGAGKWGPPHRTLAVGAKQRLFRAVSDFLDFMNTSLRASDYDISHNVPQGVFSRR